MWSYREVITGVHGLLFGVFFLLATYALLVELLQHTVPQAPARGGRKAYLMLTAAVGWAAVLSGTFLVYPWYRAKPTAGADRHLYPRSLLLSNPTLSPLHTFSMEWKEHIAFLAPIAFTMLAYVLVRYGTQIARQPHMRRLLLAFAATALLATAVAAAAGALLNKAAPVTGPATLNAEAKP